MGWVLIREGGLTLVRTSWAQTGSERRFEVGRHLQDSPDGIHVGCWCEQQACALVNGCKRGGQLNPIITPPIVAVNKGVISHSFHRSWPVVQH